VVRDEIKVGMNCALRARPVDAPAEVQVLAASPRGGSWKIRHLAGDQSGLEEWVPSRMLLCPCPSLHRTADPVNLTLMGRLEEAHPPWVRSLRAGCIRA